MHSLLSRISKNDFFCGLICPKTKIIKRSSFRQKLWTNPFEKVWFVGLFSNFNFLVQKAFFFTENIKKRYFLNWFAKKHTWSKVRFFDKKHGPPPPPLAKSRFFVLFENLIFLVYKAFYFYAEDKKRSFWLDLPKKHTW